MNNFQKNASSQISCFKFGWMNPWAARIDSVVIQIGFSLRLFLLDHRTYRLYCPSGAVWISKTKTLRDFHSFIHSFIFFMQWIGCRMDIDDEEDWLMAEACKLYQQKNINHRN